MRNEILGVVTPKTVNCTGNNWTLTLYVKEREFALQLQDELLNIAGKGNGKLYALALVELDEQGEVIATAEPVKVIAPKTDVTKPYGNAARLLRFEPDSQYAPVIRVEAFCAAFGTDKDYQSWCRKQKCAKTGDDQNIQYAHVRRGSGTGTKPNYWGIPLRQDWHAQQHQHGEITTFGGMEWMEKQRDNHISAWIASKFGEPSLGFVSPARMVAHCEAKGVLTYLPSKYREMANAE